MSISSLGLSLTLANWWYRMMEVWMVVLLVLVHPLVVLAIISDPRDQLIQFRLVFPPCFTSFILILGVARRGLD